MKTLLFLLLLIPAFASAQYTEIRGDTISVTTSWTTITRASSQKISNAYVVHDGTDSKLVYIGWQATASSTPDTASTKRAILRSGEVWVSPPGMSVYAIWIRAKSGTVPIRHEYH